jgi:F-type H+-transporting ATPase subunit b
MHEESFFSDPRSWVAAAFVIFFLIFGAKLWSVLTGILDKRTESVRAELDEASRLRREAEAMLADATKARAAALTEARALLDGAKAEAGRLAQAAAEDAAASATRREKMALDRISAAEKAAVDDVRITAADVACVAAGRVIREGFSAEADAALVDHAIGGLAAALSPRRAA